MLAHLELEEGIHNVERMVQLLSCWSLTRSLLSALLALTLLSSCAHESCTIIRSVGAMLSDCDCTLNTQECDTIVVSCLI